MSAASSAARPAPAAPAPAAPSPAPVFPPACGPLAQAFADAWQGAWAQVAVDPRVLEAWGLAVAGSAHAAHETRRLTAMALHAWGMPTLTDLRAGTGAGEPRS